MRERLTKRNSDGSVGINNCRYYNYDDFQKMAKKLADYEDAEEQGRIIVLPCKVGDKVYIISRNKVKECEAMFVGLSADEKCSYFNFVETYTDGVFYKSHSMVFDVIGKTVFLTREEAEQALKGGAKE
ncbi:MAG: hypothetical protein IJ031_03120 [Oscillospiraceae bacterium]|nr:hypothetical protein [Oscillospiraceae bacterium]MBQ8378060.1 hypothetical protein [Oscillospiraceae bacterium]MBQ8883570.1 hypothetical protein [Oscillospiraceae bacterium]